jgi:hypothetical protein
MKIVKIVLVAALAFSSSVAFAHSHKRYHHHLTRSSAGTSNPNGTAAGPTSLSGTGSSKFGGNIPGSPRAAGQ